MPALGLGAVREIAGAAPEQRSAAPSKAARRRALRDMARERSGGSMRLASSRLIVPRRGRSKTWRTSTCKRLLLATDLLKYLRNVRDLGAALVPKNKFSGNDKATAKHICALQVLAARRCVWRASQYRGPAPPQPFTWPGLRLCATARPPRASPRIANLRRRRCGPCGRSPHAAHRCKTPR